MVVDLLGQVVAQTERTPRPDATREQILDDLVGTVESLLAEGGRSRSSVLGIGVAAPGPLDAEAGVLFEPPLLPPVWHDLALGALLHEATGLPTTVEKDVVAAMVGELWRDAAQDLQDSIFVYYGAGVGAGLAVDGTPIRGRTGNAGDVAHLVVEPGGPACGCGQHGCLGAAIAPERLLVDAGVIDGGEPVAASALREHVRDLASRAQSGNDRAMTAVRRAGASLARAVVQINNLLDADVVVVGGPLWTLLSATAGPALVEAVASSTETATVRGIRVLESDLVTDAAAVGAACLVLDAAMTPRPTDLMIAGTTD
nr:ROK family protein [Microbacterium arborescens]